MLSARGLSKRYADSIALQDFSIEVKPGEVVFLTGPSGCGKSTALRLLANLDVPDTGVVRLNGLTNHDYGYVKWRTLVTYVPQSRTGLVGTPVQLYMNASSFASRRSPNDTMGNNPLPPSSATERFIDIAQSVGLTRSQVEDQAWGELSGGKRYALRHAVSPFADNSDYVSEYET